MEEDQSDGDDELSDLLAVKVKSRKLALKRWLRLLVTLRKMEHRKASAQINGDPEQIEKAQNDVEFVTAKVKEVAVQFSSEDIDCYDTSVTSKPTAWNPSEHEFHNDKVVRRIHQKARRQIEDTYHTLQRLLKTKLSAEQSSSEKDFRNEQARFLLQHMSKGSQQLDMFQNQDALLGYIRHKFIERAVLVTNSLSKLVPAPVEPVAMNEACQILWDRLQTVKIVVSIGCGPGCDALGMAAWFDAAISSYSARDRRAILLDWAISDWQSPILDTLHPLMVPSCFHQMDFAKCDVTRSLKDPSNNQARQFLVGVGHEGGVLSGKGGNALVVTSYLLSETRNRWYDFYSDIFESSALGTLFLFTDPTAFQVRHFLKQHAGRCCFNWLDSSLPYPALQELEKRVGPAALLAMKTA